MLTAVKDGKEVNLEFDRKTVEQVICNDLPENIIAIRIDGLIIKKLES